MSPDLPAADSDEPAESASPADRCSGAIVLAAGLGLICWSLTLRLGTFAVPGPGAFPLLLSSILSLLGAVLLFKQVRAGFSWEVAAHVFREKSIGIGVVLAVFLFYTFAFYGLGFILVNTVALAAILTIIQRVSVVKSVAYALALSVGSQVMFNDLLGLRLPAGILRSLGVG